ncbi:basic amino acid ABC transporter substrate-binding protein [Chloroflexia bacterium SDU3-3]|nr:basic amino acid ABC transporter substrate-binding protein [Chloroflexia bacterium SDU3-3]
MRKNAFLPTILLAGLLAACGASNTSTTATSPARSTVEAAMTAAAATEAPAAEATAEATAAATTEASATAEATTEASATAAAAPVADLKGRKVVVGTDASYPPFESVDQATNEIVGFDIDLLTEVGKLINADFEFQNASFDTIFTALQAKQFDAVASASTITDERKQIVDFSDPYIDVGQLVVVQAANTTVSSYTDLPGLDAVGVQTGTTGETAALEDAKVEDAKLKRYQTIDLAFADLANNAVDAVVADGPTVGNYTSQPQYAGKFKIVGEAFTTESYGVALQKGDTELLGAINAALKVLKENGTIDQLRAKYNIK